MGEQQIGVAIAKAVDALLFVADNEIEMGIGEAVFEQRFEIAVLLLAGVLKLVNHKVIEPHAHAFVEKWHPAFKHLVNKVGGVGKQNHAVVFAILVEQFANFAQQSQFPNVGCHFLCHINFVGNRHIFFQNLQQIRHIGHAVGFYIRCLKLALHLFGMFNPFLEVFDFPANGVSVTDVLQSIVEVGYIKCEDKIFDVAFFLRHLLFFLLYLCGNLSHKLAESRFAGAGAEIAHIFLQRLVVSHKFFVAKNIGKFHQIVNPRGAKNIPIAIGSYLFQHKFFNPLQQVVAF